MALGSAAHKHDKGRRRLKETATAYSFILPFLIFITTFSLIPIVYLFYYSLRSGSIMGTMEFVGLENYRRILASGEYYRYFLHSLIYIAFTIPIGQIIAFTLASLLKGKVRVASPVMETVLFLPLLISMVGASVIMSYLFAPNGPINYLVILLGLPPINWIGTTWGARVIIIVLELWKGTGLYIFVYLSALRSISADYYEVAKIEGAKARQALLHVTLPLVRRTIFFCVTMTFIWQIQIFDSVYVATQGGPFQSTKTVVYSIYESTFLRNRPGLGSALSVLFLFVILLITALQNHFTSRLETLDY